MLQNISKAKLCEYGFTVTRYFHGSYYRKNYMKPQRLGDVSIKSGIEEEKVFTDTKMGLRFIRMSNSHPTLKNMMANIHLRKRTENGQIIVEGRNLIREAIKCNVKMDALFFSNRDQLRQLNDEVGILSNLQQIKIYRVPQQTLKMLSVLTTPPGLLGIFQKPNIDSVKNLPQEKALPITVVCDNIREPNNLGSIIRTCAAISCYQVIVMKGCCDPWEPKALRGGCGAHFCVKIHDDVRWNNFKFQYLPESLKDCRVFVAENNLKKIRSLPFEFNNLQNLTMAYTELEGTGKHSVVIIGGESHGVSIDAYRLLNLANNESKIVHIPLANGIDSLNAASALTLILYELKKNSQNL